MARRRARAAAPVARGRAGAGVGRRLVLRAQHGGVRQSAPTAFEGFQKSSQAPYEKIPYFERRPLDFYFGWHLGIYARPFFQTGLKPRARFFPVLIASTFNDYYVFSYSGGGKYNEDRWVSGAGVTFGCMSVVAGTAIALVTVIAWFGAVRASGGGARTATRMRASRCSWCRWARCSRSCTSRPNTPNDNFGPIKGAYLQFVAPVMCALFGVGVDWMWRRRARWRWRAPALAALAAVVFVRGLFDPRAASPAIGPRANTAAPFFLADWK